MIPWLIGGALAIGLAYAMSGGGNKRHSSSVVMQAGKPYRVTLELDSDEEADALVQPIVDAGGILDLSDVEGSLAFEMRPAVTTVIHVPGELAFLPGVVVTNIEEIRE